MGAFDKIVRSIFTGETVGVAKAAKDAIQDGVTRPLINGARDAVTGADSAASAPAATQGRQRPSESQRAEAVRAAGAAHRAEPDLAEVATSTPRRFLNAFIGENLTNTLMGTNKPSGTVSPVRAGLGAVATAGAVAMSQVAAAVVPTPTPETSPPRESALSVAAVSPHTYTEAGADGQILVVKADAALTLPASAPPAALVRTDVDAGKAFVAAAAPQSKTAGLDQLLASPQGNKFGADIYQSAKKFLVDPAP